MALKAWRWAQWVFNPAVALARSVTQGYGAQANQQLVTNLGQLLREATLKALGERAIALYSGEALQSIVAVENEPLPRTEQTQTLRDIFAQATAQKPSDPAPLNLLLIGRTGAGKSSLINTLFRQSLATVDVLPSTDRIQSYTFSVASGETLLLWDTPGYEQVGMSQYSQAVLEKAATADLALLVTPVQDPTLQMDLERVSEIKRHHPELPILTVVTQADRLRPIREWDPPYDWQNGTRSKEQNIRDAIQYRESFLKDYCAAILPLVTEDLGQGRSPWGDLEIVRAILQNLDPAKEVRLSRFLRNVETRAQAAAKIIDKYAVQMGTVQGMTALLKSPILRFLSTYLTGSPALAIVLTEKLSIEKTPIILGRLQMAFELFLLLSDSPSPLNFELLMLWPFITKLSPADDFKIVSQEAWALGQTLTEYWIGQSSLNRDEINQVLSNRYLFYLQNNPTV
jgi:small GTP-binding protein